MLEAKALMDSRMWEELFSTFLCKWFEAYTFSRNQKRSGSFGQQNPAFSEIAILPFALFLVRAHSFSSLKLIWDKKKCSF